VLTKNNKLTRPENVVVVVGEQNNCIVCEHDVLICHGSSSFDSTQPTTTIDEAISSENTNDASVHSCRHALLSALIHKFAINSINSDGNAKLFYVSVAGLVGQLWRCGGLCA
jgi:hypothetical protein